MAVWTELKTRIQAHYDTASDLYQGVWGIHVHHGYWQQGTETKEVAQEQLTALLADRAQIRNGSRILDIGCGFGASAKYLADRFSAQVLGINISERQMATAAVISRECAARPQFVVMDAELLGIRDTFDVVWSIEAVSHLVNKKEFFRRVVELLLPPGQVAIMDWFEAEGLRQADRKRYIDPIVHYMLLPELKTMSGYAEYLQEIGCRIIDVADITRHVRKTWDICIELIQMPAVLSFAVTHGPDCIAFLKGVRAIQQGLRAGAFRYGMLIAEKQP